MAELLDLLVQGVALALLSLGTAGIGWLAPRVARTLALADDQRIRDYLLRTVEVAVEYGQAEARRQLRSQSTFVSSQAAAEREHREAVRIAAEYVEARVPDALDHFKVPPSSLTAMIRARMPGPPPGTAG